MSIENKAIVEKVNGAFAEGKSEAFIAMCADDVEWTILGDRTLKSKEEIRTFSESMNELPPQFSVDQIIAEGDSVACHGSMTMKGKDGEPESYSYCDIYRIIGGKITELITFVVKTKSGRNG